MGLIKKYHQQIISYGLIITGTLCLIILLIIRPSIIAGQELYSYGSESTMSKISFPFSFDITPSNPNTNYIEIQFGDDSINNHTYSVTATQKSKELFKHTYINESSNIIRLPMPSETIDTNEAITIVFDCQKSCHDVNFDLYDTPNGFLPKILIGAPRTNLYFYWFAIFMITVGLTLLPFINKEHKK